MALDALTFHLDKVVRSREDELGDFDGPLDLILHLLSKNRVEIKDIRIADLVDQYLAWMAAREALNLEVASDFAAMAAHLVYIKSRMLLSIEDEEAMSELELLMASLEERQRQEVFGRLKSVTDHFAQRYEVGKDCLTKPPEQFSSEKTYQYSHHRMDLRRAMAGILRRSEARVPPPVDAFEGIVGREPYPVAEKARAILEGLLRSGVARFRALFSASRSRSEVVATFLAVLELCRANRVRLAGTAEDCTVTCTGEGEELTDFTSEGS